MLGPHRAPLHWITWLTGKLHPAVFRNQCGWASGGAISQERMVATQLVCARRGTPRAMKKTGSAMFHSVAFCWKSVEMRLYSDLPRHLARCLSVIIQSRTLLLDHRAPRTCGSDSTHHTSKQFKKKDDDELELEPRERSVYAVGVGHCHLKKLPTCVFFTVTRSATTPPQAHLTTPLRGANTAASPCSQILLLEVKNFITTTIWNVELLRQRPYP